VQLAGIDPGSSERSGPSALRVRQAGSSVRKRDASGGRQPNASGQPFQEGPAKLPLQNLDLMREARLAHMKANRRRCERTVIDNGHEILELPKRHSHAEILS
jgi:hypothetical protein